MRLRVFPVLRIPARTFPVDYTAELHILVHKDVARVEIRMRKHNAMLNRVSLLDLFELDLGEGRS
jgi:hypothetical protein